MPDQRSLSWIIADTGRATASRANAVFTKVEMLHTVTSSDSATHPNRIIVQRESLGTAVAVDLAIRQQCAAVILESPLMSAVKVAGTLLPFLGPLLVHGYDTYSKISRVLVPLMVIHGDADEVVPFSQGEGVFRALNEPKEFWPVSGAHHNDLLDIASAGYVARLRRFYRGLRN